jgi:hypothetical protein
MSDRPEITWSIMHPVAPDPAYMRDVIAAAEQYQVDSFEICGDVHGSSGNIDGAIRFRDYPVVAGRVDGAGIDRTVSALRDVVALAHASQRPVYYWHREVMVPRAIVETIPGLLDVNGEFDLLGAPYRELVRSKIREFFDAVPEMDGLVLTLTESDYSVIHNSDPRRYPPQQVVANLVGIFTEELKARGKRFILRSFGSVTQDYEDILAGAELAGGGFEIETKITPYDFSPFLPFNPFLKRTAGCTLSAEYDSIGEFLGAGFLPAADPERVIASVAYARAQQVDRHVIRVDRIGHPTFGSTQAINLLAFDRSIADPSATADAVWREWADKHWPACAREMTAIMARGIECVRMTHFIDGNVIFHAFPIAPDLKWIKACGILSLFSPPRALGDHVGMWGILPERTTPGRSALLREKDEAVAIADAGLATVEQLRDRLSISEYRLAQSKWENATIVARAIRAWCRAVAGYFDDMEQARSDSPTLAAAVSAAQIELATFASLRREADSNGPASVQPAHEYGGAEPSEDSVAEAYIIPIWRHIAALPSEFRAEFRERAQWRSRPGAVDFVVPGGLVDDIRVNRYMHASHARLLEERPVRFVGNRVFPNGFIDVRLALPKRESARLVVTAHAGAARQLCVVVNGKAHVARLSAVGEFSCDLLRQVGAASPAVHIRIQKQGAEYPAVHGIGVISTPSRT